MEIVLIVIIYFKVQMPYMNYGWLVTFFQLACWSYRFQMYKNLCFWLIAEILFHIVIWMLLFSTNGSLLQPIKNVVFDYIWQVECSPQYSSFMGFRSGRRVNWFSSSFNNSGLNENKVKYFGTLLNELFRNCAEF